MAKAWVDADENGEWDEGEPPLAGVRFTVEGDLDTAQGGISDEQGEASVGAINMSCGTSFSICAQPVPGYRLTTSRCVSAKFPGGFLDNAYEPGRLLFGFAQAEESP